MKRAYKLLAVLLGVLVLGGCAQRGAAPASVPSSAAPTPGSVQAFPENGLEPVDTTVLADLQRRAAALADVCRPWLEQQQPGGAEALRTALAGAGETLLAAENGRVSAVSAPSGMFAAFRQAAMATSPVRSSLLMVAA